MDESLEHIITSCHYSKKCWAEVIKWFDKQGIAIAHLSDEDIMLGIVRCDDELFVNHVILVAKQYLYYCRQKSFLPSIRVLDSSAYVLLISLTISFFVINPVKSIY